MRAVNVTGLLFARQRLWESPAASYRRIRAINARCKCGKNHASDELCSIFRDGRSCTRPSRSESHTRFSPILRVIHDSALSRLREVVGITLVRDRAGSGQMTSDGTDCSTSSFALNQTSETASRPRHHRPWSCPPGA